MPEQHLDDRDGDGDRGEADSRYEGASRGLLPADASNDRPDQRKSPHEVAKHRDLRNSPRQLGDPGQTESDGGNEVASTYQKLVPFSASEPVNDATVARATMLP